MLVGFIGLGNMGSRMSANVQKAGYDLVVHDLRRNVAQPLIDKGAKWANSPKEVAEQCRIVLASLPGPADFEAVLFGENSVLKGAKPGDIFVDLTTNSPLTVQKGAAIAKEKGVIVIDSPVSGGIYGAQDATLAVMVGGDEKAFETAKPILQKIGKNVFHLGPVGCGDIAKLCNNTIGLSGNAVIAEAFVLGVKAGIDAKKLYDVVMASSGRTHSLEVSFPKGPFIGNYEPGFAIDLAYKDLNLSTTLGRELNVPMPMANAALQRYVEARARGMGNVTSQGIIKLLEDLVGVQVRINKQEAKK